ncbi:unnamed protein product [Blepharisma stoltei]|uniref:PKD/REJ-like domain-containing protein n=1 Tax=Blepharisma stoltei TaxID=1481888 RepID=A0AAU9JG01_9CILI|nr:unnamed protein product [Blepharisma stoltei]
MGTGPVCSWSDAKTLKIALGTQFSLRDSTINLDGTWILKDTQDPCTINYQPLSVSIKMPTSPSPVAVITGPQTISLGCNNDAIVYSADKSTGNYGASLTYKWSSTSVDLILQATGFSISIPKSSISSSLTSLTVTVQITNTFALTSSASMTTTISPQETLTVSFDSGSTISMKASESKTVKALVAAICGSSATSISWQWAYTSGPSSTAATNLASSATTQKLSISSNLLAAGGPYVFTATATQNTNSSPITGSASVSITVTSSPLVIQLSKGSGDVNKNLDFIIDASSSKDPDTNSADGLAYAWTCTNHLDGTACSIASYLSSQSSSALTIPKASLVVNQWDLTCTISKDSRTASYTITLNIIDISATTNIAIPTISVKANYQQLNRFSASVSGGDGTSILWSQSSGTKIQISPNNLSYLSLTANSLAEGMSYVFSLTITSGTSSFSVDLALNVNLGAACSDTVPSVNPSSGTALTTSFSISISNCYDRDGEDYPILYTFEYSTDSGTTYRIIGSTTEQSQISYYMPAGTITILAHVCDQLNTCMDYTTKSSISVKDYVSRRLQSDALRTSYSTLTLDPDNIPSTITLFCSSASIDSSLFSTMWSDLKSYVSSQSTMTNTLLDSVLGAVYSLSTQKGLMTLNTWEEFIVWVDNLLTTYTSLVPTADNLDSIVEIGESYLNYGINTTFSEQTFEKYVLYVNNFYTTWAIASTANDLVTQSSINDAISTAKTHIYKDRNFPEDMQNTTRYYSTVANLTYPGTLDYSNTNIMNMRANFYHGFTDDFSAIAIFSLANSGTYKDYSLNPATETYVPFSSSDYPFLIELPYSKNIGEGMVWGCVYYNETSSNWTESNCKIVSINNSTSTVTFKVYHFSMYKLTEVNPSVNPPPYVPITDSSCDDNYAPLYILVVVLFIGLLLAPIMVIIDRISPSSPTQAPKDAPPNTPASHSPRPTLRGLMRPNISVHASQGEESIEDDDVDSSDEEGVQSQDIDLTENSVVEQIEAPIEKPEPEVKYELQELIEGHLVFGLIYYRPIFSRVARVFTLIVAIVFELLLEGLLYYGSEDINSGSETATQTLFDNYEGKYFGYMILALAITIPVEVFMIVAFSIDRKKAPIWPAIGVIVGLAVLIGSIVGVVMLSYDFCHEWSGYWAVSFLWGILIEIFIMETIYMIVRYFLIQAYPSNEAIKS